jgi:hypothetical protein
MSPDPEIHARCPIRMVNATRCGAASRTRSAAGGSFTFIEDRAGGRGPHHRGPAVASVPVAPVFTFARSPIAVRVLPDAALPEDL